MEQAHSDNLSQEVTKKELSITGVTAASKVYNGNTNVTLNTASAVLVGKVGSDNVSLVSGSASGVFADKNAGDAKTIIASGFSLSGTAADNYTLTQPSDIKADITKATVTVTANTDSKTYDGTANSAVSPSVVGIIAPDVASTDPIQVFADPNAGTEKTITASGLAINDGNSGNNYNISYVNKTTGIINKANQVISWENPANITYGTALSATQLNATATAGALTYDPAIDAVLNAGSQTLNVTAAATENYNEATKQVTIVVDKANQVITWDNPANITYGTALSATQLNATAVGDLTYTPALNTILDAGTHTLSVTAAATENNSEAIKEVTLIVDKATPVIKIESASASSIYGDPVDFSVSVSGINDTPLTGTVLLRCIESVLDTAELNSGKVIFTTSRLEANDLHAPNAVFLGDDNYNNCTSNYLNHHVGVKALNVSGITAKSKVYDGSTAASLSGTGILSGVVNNEEVFLEVSEALGEFADKNVGTDKPVKVSGLTIKGSGAKNYKLEQPEGIAGAITPRPVTIEGITADNKIYDGTTLATLKIGTSLQNVISGDEVTLLKDGATGNFIDKNVAKEVKVIASGFGISGEQANNYTIVQPEFNAEITKAPLTITADNKTKSFNGGIYSDGYTVGYNGFVNNETADILGGILNFSGEAIDATSAGFYSIIPAGLSALNYEITYVNGTLNITDIGTFNNSPEDSKSYVTVYRNPSVYGNVNFKFGLNYNAKVTIDIIDMKGLLVGRAFEGNVIANEVNVITYKNALPTGTYIYRLKSGTELTCGKFIVAK
ncbi:MAG: YDG domain-containing protein [Paludibacter sp.]